MIISRKNPERNGEIFRDGQTDTIADPTNVYAAAGTYLVHFEVADTTGAVTKTSIEVTVAA